MSSLQDAQAAIVAALRKTNDEISHYPGPISGCDAQFNYLLDCRRRLERAMAALSRPEFIPTPRQPA
jgi:hypothetical protein